MATATRSDRAILAAPSPQVSAPPCDAWDGPPCSRTTYGTERGVSANRSLYHYTTASGLLGILTTQTIRATDVRFLNDAREALYARDLVLNAISQMDNPVLRPDHFAHDLGHYAVETFEEYKRYFFETLASTDFGVYAACFCESGDLLSQWRGYGAEHGYAIELDAAKLAAVSGSPAMYTPASRLIEVRYGSEAAADIASEAVRAVGDFNLNHPGVKSYYKALEVSALLATVKDPAFRQEEEWRLLAALEPEGPAGGPGAPESLVKYRSTSMAIVPYIELPFAIDAIRSIRLGPGNYGDVREAGVRKLLASLGSSAAVSRSEVPLRA